MVVSFGDVSVVVAAQRAGKPLAIILAGHNGSGTSTLGYEHRVDGIRIPLINADRRMLSLLPVPRGRALRPWAQKLRDADPMWMAVARKGVESFVAQAMAKQVPFAVETVFSYCSAAFHRPDEYTDLDGRVVHLPDKPRIQQACVRR